MAPIKLQYIVDEQMVRKAVVLSIEDWERIIEELEELDDIRAYDEAKAEPQEFVPLDQAMREIREQRGE